MDTYEMAGSYHDNDLSVCVCVVFLLDEIKELTRKMNKLSQEFNCFRYKTTSVAERGGEIISCGFLQTDDVLMLCKGEPPPEVVFRTDPNGAGKLSGEDYEVNGPTHRMLEKLIPEIFLSHLTCKSSPLMHNVNEYRVDIVINEGIVLTWSSCIIFGEGKCTLTGYDLKSAIGQCSQRTFAFMAETEVDYLSTERSRNVVWAFFFDQTQIGFYCRRRNETILFPFKLPEMCPENCLEVVFSVQPFHTDTRLDSGGQFLWRLLRTPHVLDYYGKEKSQPCISLQSSGHRDSWRSLSVLSQRHYPEETNVLSSVVIAVNQSGSTPTHVAKLFSEEHDRKAEQNIYVQLGNVNYTASVVPSVTVKASCGNSQLSGFVITPYGSAIAKNPDGHMKLSEIPRLAYHIGSAIADIHGKSVVHRDITPNNIIMNGQNYCLIDFNVAYRVKAHFFTQRNSFIGTRRWASLRRQIDKHGQYPKPSPLDDWESLCLTLLDLCGLYAKASWRGFQEFSKSNLPNISVNEPHYFLVSWYTTLVSYQKEVPNMSDHIDLQKTFLKDFM